MALVTIVITASVLVVLYSAIQTARTLKARKRAIESFGSALLDAVRTTNDVSVLETLVEQLEGQTKLRHREMPVSSAQSHLWQDSPLNEWKRLTASAYQLHLLHVASHGAQGASGLLLLHGHRDLNHSSVIVNSQDAALIDIGIDIIPSLDTWRGAGVWRVDSDICTDPNSELGEPSQYWVETLKRHVRVEWARQLANSRATKNVDDEPTWALAH